MLDRLLLLSGNDVPFYEARAVIHCPTIKEIGLIGQPKFFSGCEYLNFSKNTLKEQDRKLLTEYTDFEVLMTIIKNDDVVIREKKIDIELVLSLLFPQYQINFLPMSIMLIKDGENHLIDKDNFSAFKNIVSQIFCLQQLNSRSNKYNVEGPQGEALKRKFEQRERKLAQLKHKDDTDGINILYSYVSILSVGQHKDMNQLLQYTVYQLFDEFRRFRLNQDFDIYMQAKMAGAKDLQQVKNWMGDIYSDNL